MRNMDWYMREWGTFCSLLVLQPDRQDGCWPMESTVSSNGMSVVFFSSTTWNIHGKGYNNLESFADPLPSFIPHQQMKQDKLASNDPLLSEWVVQLRVWQGNWKGDAAGQEYQEAPESDLQQGIGGGGQFSLRFRRGAVLLHQECVDDLLGDHQEERVGWWSLGGSRCMDWKLSGLWDLDEQGMRLLMVPASAGWYLLRWCCIEAQEGPKNFEPRKKYSRYLAISTGTETAVLIVCPVSQKFVSFFRICEVHACKESSSGADHDSSKFSIHRSCILAACNCRMDWWTLIG